MKSTSKQKIHFLGLNKLWVPGREFSEVTKILENSDYLVSKNKLAFNSKVYLHDKYSLKRSFYHLFKNKVYFDYFHGNPSVNPEFSDLFNYIINNPNKYHKIRVTNDKICKLFFKYGLKEKICKIYLGVDNQIFRQINTAQKLLIKKNLNIPEDYIVIGSFQKDGEGWGKGLMPKMIKGPDIFIEVVNLLKKQGLKIFVLLLGPSRGFLKKELEKINIKFTHIFEKNYQNMCNYYNVLDFYLISSREEGGPKALLESMACGVPVITTPTGQSVDLIQNEYNGIIVKNFSAITLADKLTDLINNENLQNKIKIEGKKTALENDYKNQKTLWENFFK